MVHTIISKRLLNVSLLICSVIIGAALLMRSQSQHHASAFPKLVRRAEIWRLALDTESAQVPANRIVRNLVECFDDIRIFTQELLFAQGHGAREANAQLRASAAVLASSELKKKPADLIVTGGIVVTMDSAATTYNEGAVIVTGDTIAAVGPRVELESQYQALQTIDATGKLVLPGFVNGHTHAPMTLLRGLHDDVTLDEWLHKYIFPAEAKNVNEDFVRWGTRLAAAEQIRSGITTFADMYYFEDAIAEETKAAGMRGVLGETFIDFAAPDNKNRAEMLAYTERFLKRWQGDRLIHAATAPHSIYTCSQKTLQDASALARKYHAPILIHVAEMKKEWDDSQKQNGMSPVQYLQHVGVLGNDVVAAHCVFVDEADRKILAQRHVGCIHNPSSNMMLASGVAPVPELRAAGVAVGLGTDGPAGSNNDLDLMEEIDLAAKLAKITKMDPVALNAKAAVEMATIDGAKALHLEREIGSLEKGKKADLILISLDEPNAVPMYDIYAQVAYALKASDVATVVIGGRIVMRNRKLLTLNAEQAIAKAREYKKTIAASIALP